VHLLHDGRWNHVHFNGRDSPMLFDRAEDPGEFIDIVRAPAASGEIRRLAAAMLDRRMTRADRRLTGISFSV
jgi:hypothetical protein